MATSIFDRFYIYAFVLQLSHKRTLIQIYLFLILRATVKLVTRVNILNL